MTILFYDDLNEHKQAMIHYSTKNESFLKLAEIYNKMGVKNCFFHLLLLNPELEHVDARDENLPWETKVMVVKECKENFWYYLREVHRVSAPGKPHGNMFRANRSNIALYWLYFNHITVFNTVIRQTGKTTTLVTLMLWLMNFGSVSTDIGFLSKDAALKGETMGDLKEQFGFLPDYLNMSTKHDVFNGDVVNISGLNNSLIGMVSNQSPVAANKVGRGFTFTTLLIDECAFVPNIEIALGSLVPSGNFARAQAKIDGRPYGQVFTTTAGSTADRDGRFIFNILSNSTLWSEKFYDCKNEDELIDMIMRNSSAQNVEERKPIVNLTLSYSQIGLTDEWMKERLAESATASKESISRDLFNKWTTGSNSSPLDADDLDKIEDSRDTEPRTEIFAPYSFILRWYVTENLLRQKIDFNHNLIIGLDTSDGAGRDDIGMVVRDHATGEVLCAATFNEINLFSIANFFVDFLVKYPNSTMIIERHSSAIAIIDFMITLLVSKGINPFKRMYNTIFQEKEKYEKAFEEIVNSKPEYSVELYIKHKVHLGFRTSAQGITSRSELYSTTLYNMVKYTAHTTRDAILINQIQGLTIKNGRVDHVDGAHDDTVIAALLSYWLLYMGRNLHLYGIDTKLLLRKNEVYLDEKFNTADEKNAREELEGIEREVNRLMDMMRYEDNPIINSQYEKRIRFLYKDIKKENGYISIEEMLAGIKKDKQLKRNQY